MACGSSCCGPPPSPVAAASAQLPSAQSLIQHDMDICCDARNFTAGNTGEDACGSYKEPAQPAITNVVCNEDAPASDSRPSEQVKEASCCDGKTEMQDDYCERPEIASTVCQKECCVGSTEKPLDSDNGSCGRGDITAVDECCTPKSNDHHCKKSCGAEPDPPPVEEPNNPSCCKGKASPCCDVSCLDHLALRECENRKQAAQPDHASKSRPKCSVQRRYIANVANSQVPQHLVQARAAPNVETEKHVATTLAPPVIGTRLPWTLSAASVAPYWPSGKTLAVGLENARLLRVSAAPRRRLFRALLLTLCALREQV